AERDEANARRVEVERRAAATDRLAAVVADRLATIESTLADLHERRRAQSEVARAQAAELDARRRERTEVERSLSGVRERLARIELADAESRVRIETAAETLRRDLDVAPEEAIETECPPLPEGTT